MNHVLLKLILALAIAGPVYAGEIHGAGATFPYPAYARWAADYTAETQAVVRYEPVGSGEGVIRMRRGEVDFGATDAPLAPDELAHDGLIQFPVLIGAVVPVVNIRGIGSGELKLTGDVLGGIYLGTIQRWDDPAIAALNPGLHLPHENITAVHRSDASGTTFLLSHYLAQTCPAWKARMVVATALNWPSAVAGVGNEGVASYVQRTRMSLGYVEYAYARSHRLTTVALRNRSGLDVAASPTAFAAAAAAARWQERADLSQILVNQPGAGSWPLTGSSFILVTSRSANAAAAREVVQFFDWAQKKGRGAAADLGYVPLPDAAMALVRQLWADERLLPSEAGEHAAPIR